MLLTMKQRYVVGVLNKLGCLRRDQLYILTRDRFKTEDFTLSEYQMDEILRQLPFLVNEIRVENGVVRLSDHKPEPLRLEAIDVMLELSNGYPIRFSAVRDEDILTGLCACATILISMRTRTSRSAILIFCVCSASTMKRSRCTERSFPSGKKTFKGGIL